MTDHAVSKVVKEKLCEYLKAAVINKENVSSKNISEILGNLSSENILGYLTSENIPGEVLGYAISWLDSLIDTEQTPISDENFELSFLLKDLPFHDDTERRLYVSNQLSQLAILQVKLVKKQSKLTEQEKTALDQENAKLKGKRLPDYKGSEQTFKHISQYKSIADALRKENKLQVVEEMNRLAGEIYTNQNKKYKVTPSFVVCCSSGTGKTQLPFCFKNEILYFVLETSQDIYEEYSHISNYLSKLIDIDFEKFCEGITFKKEREFENDQGYNLAGFSRKVIRKRVLSLYSLGFIFNLIKTVADLKRKPGNETKGWIELELDENIYIPFSALTIDEATGALKDLVKSGTVARLPLIFLDEFNIGANSSKKAKAYYSFYRNIFRAAGLIPVVMGTDSNITNLVPTNNNGSGTQKHIWGFVFYKLPPYPSELLKSKL